MRQTAAACPAAAAAGRPCPRPMGLIGLGVGLVWACSAWARRVRAQWARSGLGVGSALARRGFVVTRQSQKLIRAPSIPLAGRYGSFLFRG